MSSLVVAVSSTMSATAPTVTLTVAVSVIAARGDRVGEAVGAVEVGIRRVDDEVVGRGARVPLSLTVTVPCVPLVVAVIAGGPRRCRSPARRTLTAVSSLVVTVSSTMSATAFTVTLTVAVSAMPPEVTV